MESYACTGTFDGTDNVKYIYNIRYTVNELKDLTPQEIKSNFNKFSDGN